MGHQRSAALLAACMCVLAQYSTTAFLLGPGRQHRLASTTTASRTVLQPLQAESNDPWIQALQEAQGKSTGGLLGLEGLEKAGSKLRGLKGPAGEADKRLEQNSALLNWLADNGVWVYDKSDWGQAPHSLAVAVDTVDEAENERAGRGMVANREIKEGDELFHIPLDLLLTKERARTEFGHDVITDDMSEYIAIALLLMGERAKGKDSFWAPYINVLPTLDEVAPTWSWPEEELSLLEGSPVIRSTESMARKLEAEYAALQQGILTKHAALFAADAYTFDAFRWAFAMLFSRAIRLASLSDGEAIALVPYADLLNHNPFANAYVDARQTGWLKKVDEVAVYSDRAYKRMEQIYISYGPKSNADLLLLYGFALDRNPFNSVDITVALDGNDPLFPQKKAFLDGVGQPTTMNFPMYNDRYPDEALQYLRLICLAPEDNKAGVELDRLEFANKISDANELRVLSLIQAACEAALEGYPTTEEQDTAVMSDRGMFGALTKNQRMAVKHRRQEKRILKRTIAAVTKERQRLSMPLGI
ncbi:putative ribulose-1,5-bisphosphate carboxylase/oxygenase small subunit N-methyltransferase I [Tribonema minus]|uniref:Putative ribulose-1,5-bisphosphate carboxylase/oxygenase small subunit N-methyltransferase I n=1 Tax=Tribonema minus TaxID=303371 RepID=A0A836CJC2_9STRA|nr:putative ribulose-1,5-bisphosphate carboxylase/oxygenase small subunit N-methyltransferase I [Tribonema minus]